LERTQDMNFPATTSHEGYQSRKWQWKLTYQQGRFVCDLCFL
jgi:hypothetical protein